MRRSPDSAAPDATCLVALKIAVVSSVNMSTACAASAAATPLKHPATGCHYHPLVQQPQCTTSVLSACMHWLPAGYCNKPQRPASALIALQNVIWHKGMLLYHIYCPPTATWCSSGVAPHVAFNYHPGHALAAWYSVPSVILHMLIDNCHPCLFGTAVATQHVHTSLG